ncbi:MAG: hypothetical protein P8Y80_11005 [Acidobacteriota bacterium]
MPFIASGQQVIGIRAGLVNFIAGGVYLDGQRMEFLADKLQEIPVGINLQTEFGLAEIELGAGAFLRANQRTLLRMESVSLENIVLRLERGSILIEIFEMYEDNHIGVHIKDVLIEFDREGLYRLDANRNWLRVYGGKATVQNPDRKVSVKSNKTVDLITLSTSKFDTRINDAFHYWAAYRSFKHNQQLLKLHWYSDHWQPLLMNRFRNGYYEVTYYDKEMEDEDFPGMRWYY